jgi:hypothetical protein
METINRQPLPTREDHRLLVRNGRELLVVLPDSPLALFAIAALPGDYELAERTACAFFNSCFFKYSD